MGLSSPENFPAGSKHGEWTVIEPRIDARTSHMLARCKCGSEQQVWRAEVARGGSDSCKPCAIRTHGKTHTKTYRAWMAMRERCNNPRHFAYHNYGGRGIKVSPDWDTFERFLSDMGEAPEKLTLDRTDNSRGYEPGNCRWVSMQVQQSNRRNKGGSSPYRGVSLQKCGKYRAGFKRNHVNHYLGEYVTQEEAARVYDAAVAPFGYPLNFPEARHGQ